MMFRLSDQDAAELTRLLVLYFTDCVAEDPSTTRPADLTVLDLVDDLQASTAGVEGRAIEENREAILGLFEGGA